jgi:phosphate uptake regulator
MEAIFGVGMLIGVGFNGYQASGEQTKMCDRAKKLRETMEKTSKQMKDATAAIIARDEGVRNKIEQNAEEISSLTAAMEQDLADQSRVYMATRYMAVFALVVLAVTLLLKRKNMLHLNPFKV